VVVGSVLVSSRGAVVLGARRERLETAWMMWLMYRYLEIWGQHPCGLILLLTEYGLLMGVQAGH